MLLSLSAGSLALLALVGVLAAGAAAQPPRLLTRWAADVDPDLPRPEYPRPQLVRTDWMNLNGRWEFGMGAGEPVYDRQIVVPFAPESALSGVQERVPEGHAVFYRRTFELPADWAGKRIILHFGAVDHRAIVTVNGERVGEHSGGYDPFSFEITRFLKPGQEQVVEVSATDPTDRGFIPRGKQVVNPSGIFYTPVTGIWQTVWLEPVDQGGLQSVRINPDAATGTVDLKTYFWGNGAERVRAEAFDGKKRVAAAEVLAGEDLRLKLAKPKLWSPDRPFLYDLKITVLGSDGKPLDEVKSYFGLRSLTLGKGKDGVVRLLLNGEPVFQMGLLDQGYWPDGLYTAPTDSAMKYDLDVTKRLGFNPVRKHVKTEPATWYAHCDRIGLLVWQDMPSGDGGIGPNDPDFVRTAASANAYELELSRMIDALYNCPSIVMWVVFNEGWGQFETPRLANLARRLDPTRWINGTSGWSDRGVGDVIDDHIYPGPGSPVPERNRAAVLGEFGGLGLPVAGHTWVDANNWGYVSYKTPEDLAGPFFALFTNLRPLVAQPGLSAAVYTQTTDVETEVNGLLTYDRAVLKVDEKRLRAAIRALSAPLPKVKTLLPTSEASAILWQYTVTDPGPGWEALGYDDSEWQIGPAGFGTEGTPGAIVRTRWDTETIWLRRTFQLGKPMDLKNAYLRIHHDEDAEVYLDGRLIAKLNGYSTAYLLVALDPRQVGKLAAGEHTLAVKVKQTQGGQYIDLGIVQLTEAEAGKK